MAPTCLACASRTSAISTKSQPARSVFRVSQSVRQRVVGSAYQPDGKVAVAPSSNGTVPVEAPKAGKDDVQGAMLEPSVANTGVVRTLATLATLVAVAGSSVLLPGRLAAFMHITSFGLWLGTLVFNTFFVGLTMFKVMPRQMFGRVQAQLFPKYFALTSGANIVLLGTLVLTCAPGPAKTKATITLSLALIASLINWLFIEPKTTKLMFERYDIENKENKSEEDKAQISALYKQFGKWHGISSLINLIVTCGAVAHGWFLAGTMTI